MEGAQYNEIPNWHLPEPNPRPPATTARLCLICIREVAEKVLTKPRTYFLNPNF